MRPSLLAVLVLAICPSTAAATPMLVLSKHGHARARNDPFLTGPAVTPAAPAQLRRGAPGVTTALARPGGGAPGVGGGSSGSSRPSRATPQPTPGTRPSPRRLRSASPTRCLACTAPGPLRSPAYSSYSRSWNAALAADKRLRGARRAELVAVTSTVHQIAAAHQLTTSRLPVLFATVDRNRQWWTTGPMLSSGQRVEFANSQLVWQFYAGQGLQLQVLGTFGKANALYTAAPAHTTGSWWRCCRR